MPKLDAAIEVLPIRVRAASAIRDAILSGEYAPGDELSLTGVADQLGISRTPIREAFQELALEGLVQLRMNRAAVVLGVTQASIKDLFEIRATLESMAAGNASERRTDVGELAKLHKVFLESSAASSPEAFAKYELEFHSWIWAASGNERLSAMLHALWQDSRIGTAPLAREQQLTAMAEHGQLLRFMKLSMTSSATRVMREHIERAQANVLAGFPFAAPIE
jgi:DNA-binding GntR family transcriptional regulator